MKNALLPQLAGNGHQFAGNGGTSENSTIELRKLLARCCLRLGEWQENLEGLKEEIINQVLK